MAPSSLLVRLTMKECKKMIYAKRTFQAFFSILVIDFSFPLVTEHFVSLSYLLELLLSPRGLVLVRVVLEGHFSVGLLDVILVGSPSQAKDLVVVFAHLHLKLVSDHWESGITKNNYTRLVERKGQSIALDEDTLTKRRGATFCWKNFFMPKYFLPLFFLQKLDSGKLPILSSHGTFLHRRRFTKNFLSAKLFFFLLRSSPSFLLDAVLGFTDFFATP